MSRPAAADFVEFLAEACATPAARREARAAAELWPVVLHGVALSLGGAEGIDESRASALGDLARELGAQAVTEHAAFVRAGGREIGHLTGLPWTRDAAGVVAHNARRARRHLPDVPFLIENVARTFHFPQDAMAEGAFYEEVARMSGCDLLLDVSNLYANAVNGGRDPLGALGQFPLEHVSMLHVAGGVFEDGFWFDTHAHPVPDDVYALVEAVLRAKGDVPIVLERDARFPPFPEIDAELRRLRATLQGRLLPEPRDPDGLGRSPYPSIPRDATRLREEQDRLARALTDERLSEDAESGLRGDELRRARQVLAHKRIERALPWLTNLARRREEVVRLAMASVGQWSRPPAFSAIADAMRIASTAAAQPHLAALAALDALMLEARFVGPDRTGTVRPRAAPFVRRAPPGHEGWVVKGFGANAEVRIVRGREREDRAPAV